MRFEGSTDYVATPDLMLAVNAAITLQRPLLVKGEPGTGKTMLAETVAAALGLPLLQWHIKSTTKAQQGLYEYDAVTRLRDSQLGDERVKELTFEQTVGFADLLLFEQLPSVFGDLAATAATVHTGRVALLIEGRLAVAHTLTFEVQLNANPAADLIRWTAISCHRRTERYFG